MIEVVEISLNYSAWDRGDGDLLVSHCSEVAESIHLLVNYFGVHVCRVEYLYLLYLAQRFFSLPHDISISDILHLQVLKHPNEML